MRACGLALNGKARRQRALGPGSSMSLNNGIGSPGSGLLTKMSTARGVKDIIPEEAIAKQRIINELRCIAESYGFSPLETPVIERFETLSSKYAGGSEILKEMFRLKDQGSRELGLRYDLTVPLARFIAMNPQTKLPFKRYQVGEVFRDGPIKLGRYREFTQFDVDVVGSALMIADAEIISLACDAFSALGLDVVVKVNNRKVLNAVIEAAGITKSKADDVILSLDKLGKLGLDAVKSELDEKGLSGEQIKKLIKIITVKGSFEEKAKKISRLIKAEEGLDEIKQVFAYINKKNVEFDVALARGLAYYTGTVFEVFLNDSGVKSSVAAGGRYDDMIGKFCGSEKSYPAVGISFGLDVVIDALKEKNRAAKKTVTAVFIIPIKAQKEAFKIVQQLRKEKINADIDLNEKGISKNLDYANALGIPFVVFIGKNELKQKKVKLRDMKTGEEKMVSVKTLISELNENNL